MAVAKISAALTLTLQFPVYIPPAPPSTSAKPAPTSAAPAIVPTPAVTTCPTPGVYTIPETTITLTETTTVCAATSTSVPAGTHTVGGVTTVVETSTTVVCPYAAVTTSGGVTTSTILTTTYVCPSAGTFTIAPITTTVVSATLLVYPTPATYAPGTYHQPEVVTTITETDYVVFCPYTSMQPPASTSAAAPVPNNNAAASPGISTSGNEWAVTYTPYTESGECKAASDVMTDMALVKSKGFSAVRLYATDCNGLQNVGAGCQAAGLKMILGVFIEASGVSGAQEQVTEIIAWAQWSLVEIIVIGNEAIFNGYCTPSDLASFISSSKAAFAAAGYTGPCTTTEPLNILQEYTEIICEVVDIVGCNIHPFFNGAVDASSAGSFVAGQLQIVEGLCPGKSGLNFETGWPSQATECNGAACASPENQQIAIDSILAAAGDKSVFLSFENDFWKDPGNFGCEQYWGMIEIIGT
jgi:exo-beta-1,3-glucanase (GH17 family)